ncbi:hypothetical protein N183_37055 [Sinorhizobium sp. Sb3]|nr:hypothetical protein N183_37055 [Sinorhizobium sp. Sb3]
MYRPHDTLPSIKAMIRLGAFAGMLCRKEFRPMTLAMISSD